MSRHDTCGPRPRALLFFSAKRRLKSGAGTRYRGGAARCDRIVLRYRLFYGPETPSTYKSIALVRRRRGRAFTTTGDSPQLIRGFAARDRRRGGIVESPCLDNRDLRAFIGVLMPQALVKVAAFFVVPRMMAPS